MIQSCLYLVSVRHSNKHLQESDEKETVWGNEEVDWKPEHNILVAETAYEQCWEGYGEQKEQGVNIVYEVPNKFYWSV